MVSKVPDDSLMALEAAEAPAICRAQLKANAELMSELGGRLRLEAPRFAATLARGSSDHAAAFAKVLVELHAGVPMLSHAPSIGAIYKATSPSFDGIPLLAISQSGRSPDLIMAAQDAQRQRALVVAVVNDSESPLAAASDIVVPIHAGPERSVAATKTLIATLFALTHLAAEWGQDEALLSALPEAPEILERASGTDWSDAAPIIAQAQDLLVVGRGYTLPIAGEAALKLKEVAGIHAEAFSSAEVAHGPMTLVGAQDPVLVLGPLDYAGAGLPERIADFVSRGAKVLASGRPEDVFGASVLLQSDTSVHPAIGAIAAVQSFYGLALAVAAIRGRDPDRPPHLAKVTRTI